MATCSSASRRPVDVRHAVRAASSGAAGALLPDARLFRGRRGSRSGDVPSRLAQSGDLHLPQPCRSGPGCTGSRPTSASTASSAGRGAPSIGTRPGRRSARGLQPPADLPWLQPYPDRLLEDVSPSNTTPDEAVVSKETIELAFLAAIQLLPPRQRAVLIVRDVLDWSAKETASLLGSSVASVNSALQRARATLKTRLPASRLEWSAAADRSAAEQLLRRYIDAYESGDLTKLANVLREDARLVMPPYVEWYVGRASIVAFAQAFSDPGASGFRGALRGVPRRPTDSPRSPGICGPTGPDVPSALAGRAPDRGRDRRRDHRFRPPRPVRGLRARADP